MIDYFKVRINEFESILDLFSEKFYYNENAFTRLEDMTSYSRIWSIENLNLKITSSCGYLDNSIHGYFNAICGSDIAHNSNDFSFTNLCFALDHLSDKLQKPLNELELCRNLEFGFNLNPSFDINSFIVNECCLYKYKSHTHLDETSSKIYKNFVSGNFKLKIYNKSLQYPTKLPTLRVELKIIDKVELHRLGIFTLEDLKDKENLYKLYNILMNIIENHLQIVDNIENCGESKYIKNILHKYCSSKYWSEYKSNNSQYFLNKERDKSMWYFNKYKLLSHKQELITLIKDKFSLLIDS